MVVHKEKTNERRYIFLLNGRFKMKEINQLRP